MKIRATHLVGALVGAAAYCLPAQADESNLKIYGFADAQFETQWYSENNILRQFGVVEPGSQAYVDHVNMYIDSRPNENLRFLAELSLNRDGRQELPVGYRVVVKPPGAPTQYIPVFTPTAPAKDHGISIPRAHADFLLIDEFNVRVGKFITPAGIWNVDHGSPTIMTVRQPYQTSYLSIFPESQTGAQVFGKTQFQDQDFSYAGWVSTGRGTSDAFSQADYGQVPQDLDDWSLGSHLQADLDLPHDVATRFGGSFHTGTVRYQTEWLELVPTGPTTSDMADITTLVLDSIYAREYCYGLDSKIEWKGFLLQGEWNHRKMLNLLDNESETDVNAWYVLAAKTFRLHKSVDVSPYLMYEVLTWEGSESNPFLSLVQTPASGFEAYTAGLNFGLFSNAHLKLEYSHQIPEPLNSTSGLTPNSYSESDLAFDAFNAQISIAY